jgi:hypothetical protein
MHASREVSNTYAQVSMQCAACSLRAWAVMHLLPQRGQTNTSHEGNLCECLSRHAVRASQHDGMGGHIYLRLCIHDANTWPWRGFSAAKHWIERDRDAYSRQACLQACMQAGTSSLSLSLSLSLSDLITSSSHNLISSSHLML